MDETFGWVPFFGIALLIVAWTLAIILLYLRRKR
jgi:hypothetical protein